jgi:hypothetical protein
MRMDIISDTRAMLLDNRIYTTLVKGGLRYWSDLVLSQSIPPVQAGLYVKYQPLN